MSSAVAALQSHLAQLSTFVGAQSFSSGTSPSCLVRISHTHLALLHTSNGASEVYILPTVPHTVPSLNSPKPISVPSDAHTLSPANDVLAVIGRRSVTIIDRPLSPSPSTRSVGLSLFSRRPGLTVLHTAWAPHAPAFLLLLTSDAILRLYDVISSEAEGIERMRLRVVSPTAPPVCFAFGRGHAWSSLSVYLLMSNGSIFVVAPIAPIGTRLSYSSWASMLNVAQAHAPDSDTLHIDSSWAACQNDMQIRFLKQVFDRSASGDMIAVREFKPAPLLFQGPLFVEHEDIPDNTVQSAHSFTSLVVLNHGVDGPPVLLRVSDRGHVSVLIALEAVEPQWFLNADPTISALSDAPTEASEEYASCALQVAPSLLCFEHIEFDQPDIALFPVGVASHSDVMLVASCNTIHALRLPFITAMNHPRALERCPHSSVVRVLSTSSAVRTNVNRVKNSHCTDHIIGAVPQFLRGVGTVAIALTIDGVFHVSTPVRWVSSIAEAAASSFLPGSSVADRVWSAQRPEIGGSAFAFADFGKNTHHLLQTLRLVEEKVGGRVAHGAFGKVNRVDEFEPLLEELERRVELYTGSGESSGLCATLGELANTAIQWGSALRERVNQVGDGFLTLSDLVHKLAGSEGLVQRKVAQIDELGALLAERIKKLQLLVNESGEQLTPVEITRLKQLKERKRRILYLKGRVEELAEAVKVFKGDTEEHERSSSGTSGGLQLSPLRSAEHSATFNTFSRQHESDGPLARKRPEWTTQSQLTSLPAKDMQRICGALEKHSSEIEEVTNLDITLRKRLSA